MDGLGLANKLAQTLQENISTSGFLDLRTTYDYLYEAALEVARRTKGLSATQAITTVAGQAAYALNSNYLGMYIRDTYNQFVAKYEPVDGGVYWPTFRDYGAVLYANQGGNPSPVPTTFSISDAPALATPISGLTTLVGASSGGASVLTDSGAPFSGVAPGDAIHNTTDGSSGVVVSVTSSSALVTALFGGTNNDWTLSDAYIVVPQGRWEIIFDPPPLSSGDAITFTYYCKPLPVYTSYGTYRFDAEWEWPLIKYAAWMYKYRDGNPNFGDAFYKQFEAQCRRAVSAANKAMDRYRIRTNYTKRSFPDRSYQ